MLENISYRFLKPNIFNIKPRTRLHDDTASEEKKARAIQVSKDTTSLETGVQSAGFWVSDMQWWLALGGFLSLNMSVFVRS